MGESRVLVAGGGPAGLASALLLARYQIPVTVLERHPGTSLHPKARGLNIRTMEILRSLGLERAVLEAGAGLEKSRNMLFVETLAGREVRRIPDDDLMMQGEALGRYTPCLWTQCAQDALEGLLFREAAAAGAEIRFQSELTGFEQDGGGVSYRSRDLRTGKEEAGRAAYLLACDGANSFVRRSLGIPLAGRAAMEHFVNIYFRADLRRLVEGRWFGICFVENPQVEGLFLPVDNEERWLLNVGYDPGKSAADQFTADYCRSLVRAAAGVEGLEVEVLSVLPWVASALVAPKMREGRVFLLGDAAHVMPPAGAFGLNTAVQEAHNLAWKIAWVLKGRAAEGLLNSYEAERLPVARTAVGYSEQEMDAPEPWQHGGEGGEGEAEGRGPWESTLEDQLKAVIGFEYASDAVVRSGGAGLVSLDFRCQPGTRFPHAWLADGRSTLDLLPEGSFAVVTAQRGTAVDSVPVVTVPEEVWAGITEPGVGAVLVRPDGVVAATGATVEDVAVDHFPWAALKAG